MLKRRALMESISSNLHSFLKKISEDLSLADKKFLRDGLIGLLRAGLPIVFQMARYVPNKRTKSVSRLDRLGQHLVKNSNFDNSVIQALPQIWLPYFQDDTPIILDLSDLAKRLAKKMDYLATVRDGSTGELVNGYWLVEVYASVSRKNPVPILPEPFSHEEPYSPGQNPVVLKSQVNLEKIRTFRWCAIRRLVLLAVLVMIYLGRTVEAYPNVADRFVRLSQTLPDKPEV